MDEIQSIAQTVWDTLDPTAHQILLDKLLDLGWTETLVSKHRTCEPGRCALVAKLVGESLRHFSLWMPRNIFEPIGHSYKIQLPLGYVRVWTKYVKDGDKYFLYRVFNRNGSIKWTTVQTKEYRKTKDDKISTGYTVLIRRGNKEIGLPCENCQAEPREDRLRFCYYCARDVIQHLREEQR